MIAHRHITKILIILVALAVAVCLLAVFFSEQLTEALGGKSIAMAYESKLFDTDEIIDINIIMDEDQWNDMLANAIAEEYYPCDVVINGTLFYSVGIRPKGNTSLTSIVNDPDTDRYSFKLEFDQYVKKQTCWGLDKLVLNNSYADYTYMKEALIYDMYRYLGADASLYNYAKISVNGEYWGAYLALEAVEDSFLLRNYGTNSGALYKPDSMGGGNAGGRSLGAQGGAAMNFGEMRLPENQGNEGNRALSPPESDGSMPAQNENGTPSNERNENRRGMDAHLREASEGGNFSPGGGRGGFQAGGGANLNYTDDKLDSYATIWEGEITKTSGSDHKRVVTALKHSSEGTDLEAYMDVDNLLKYMAVHIFSVNDDSLSGSMAHNYYLYEEKGRLNLLPWDYNLALGGMNAGNAADMVNDAIDMPFSATQFFDTLLENEEYLARYHEYLGQLVEEYVYGGAFDEFYSRTRSQIDALVQTDPTAFCSYEEYLTAADTLYRVVQLRGDSIRGQLSESIPSTESGQRADASGRVDAAGIDLSAMGTMFGARGGGGGFNKAGESGNSPNRRSDNAPAQAGSLPEDSGSAVPDNELPEGFDPAAFANGNLPEGFDRSAFAGGNLRNDSSSGTSGTGSAAAAKNLITYGICLAFLLAALIFVKLFRRRPHRQHPSP